MTNKVLTKSHKKARVPTNVLAAKRSRIVSIAKQKGAPTAEARPVPRSVKGKERASTPAPLKSHIASLHDDDEDARTPLPATFKVTVGSYEKLLYGLEGSTSAEGPSYQFDLEPIFIFPAHISSIRAVAASPHGGKWLATGSGDEIIKVWDLRKRKEVGGLMHHEGSITHLEFPSRSHLLSASEDGSLCLFHARDWTVLRALKGHKGRVNSVAVHPSGKLALSVGKDRTLRMWDLMRGKGSASTKLGKEAEIVCWSTNGSLFVVLTQSTIDIYSTDMELLHTIIHPSRLHAVRFCKRVVGEGEVLLVAAEDKKVSVYDIPSDRTVTPSIIAEMVGHSNRVKSVDTLDISLPSSASRSSTTVICTISSDGRVRLYDMAALPEIYDEKVQLHPVAQYDTKGSRLTCLALADGEPAKQSIATGKRKRNENDEEHESTAEDAALQSAEEEDHDGQDEEEKEEQSYQQQEEEGKGVEI
ncbi:WD40 repeat-like protein [Laetiporus sulphureus 93-53]|uniref:WD40 repeat-like protein n=1 Tax=Laetiporus sulphureus 93-53 TaxID=1314785 RepID=A0A165B9T9_9APHY|nr:WD40 repeat-like protein [Laetiporus sulphureus 93-53]KZT00579.1 WD40 repeat-like protein [Laetiporus sulphureus 93-53]